MIEFVEYAEQPETGIGYNQAALIRALGELTLPKKSFVVVGSGSLVLRGILEDAADLDLLASETAMSQIKIRNEVSDKSLPRSAIYSGATNTTLLFRSSMGLPITASTYMNGKGVYPLYLGTVKRNSEIVKGYQCISLPEIIASKSALRRGKDVRHLKAIKVSRPDLKVQVPLPVYGSESFDY